MYRPLIEPADRVPLLLLGVPYVGTLDSSVAFRISFFVSIFISRKPRA